MVTDEFVVSESVLNTRAIVSGDHSTLPVLAETSRGHRVTRIERLERLERGHPQFSEDIDGDMYQYIVDYVSDRSERESVGEYLPPLMQRPVFVEKPPFVHAPYIPVGPDDDFPAGEPEPSIPTTDAEQEDKSIQAGPGPGDKGSEAKVDRGWNTTR